MEGEDNEKLGASSLKIRNFLESRTAEEVVIDRKIRDRIK